MQVQKVVLIDSTDMRKGVEELNAALSERQKVKDTIILPSSAGVASCLVIVEAAKSGKIANIPG